MFFAAVDFGDFGWSEQLVDWGAFGFADHVDLLLAVFLFENGPVGVVVTDRRGDQEFVRQFHEQFDVLAAVQQFCEMAFHVGVVGDVVEVGLLLILHLVERVNEPVVLLEPVLLKFAQFVHGPSDLLVLDTLDDRLGQRALYAPFDHTDEIIWIVNELIKTVRADEDVDDGASCQ